MYRYCRNHGWWPSAPELAEKLRGSRWTVWRDLLALERLGEVGRVGRDWRVTSDGFGTLRLPAIVAKKSRPKRKTPKKRKAERLSRRVDSFRVFELDSPEIVD